MKKTLILLTATLGCAMIVGSCQKEREQELVTTFERPIDIMTKTSIVGETFDYGISMSDVLTYMKRYRPKDEVREVIPVVHKGDTVLFIVNKQVGWEIIAADMRYLPPVMQDREGEMRYPSNDVETQEWFDIMAQQVYSQKATINNEDAVKFWRKILGLHHVKEKVQTKTRTRTQYYWVRVSDGLQVTNRVLLNEVSHLIPTHWGQWYPWNAYSPYGYNEDGEVRKCPAGCTPVAMGQMLYFLHYEIGKPNGLYHTVYSTGISSPSTYTVDITTENYVSNSIRWDSMAIDSSDVNTNYVAQLLLSIGKSTNAHYGYNSTSAPMNVSEFAKYGITCSSSTSYQGGTIFNQLQSGMPVPIVCYYNSGGTYKGHSWIIDGFRTYRQTFTEFFHWEYLTSYEEDELHYTREEVQENGMIMYEGMEEQESYDENRSYFLMNLGWGRRYTNTEFDVGNSTYGPLWVINGNYYQYYFTMFYDFC